MKILDISEPVARDIIRAASELCCPPAVTVRFIWVFFYCGSLCSKASAILAAKHSDVGTFKTTLSHLDVLLKGGLPVGSITEIVGPPGVGKTQFCHTLAVVALTSLAPQPSLRIDGSVIYLDTETTFSPQR